MSERVLAFNGKDWLNTGLLVLAEGALLWLAVNLVIRPTGEAEYGMTATTVAILSFVGTALPRLCHDRGIWSGAYSVIITAGLASTTLFAIKMTSFPAESFLEFAWLDSALDSAVGQPSSALTPVWAVIVVAVAIWWRGTTRPRPDIDTALATFRAGSVILVALVVAHSLLDAGLDDKELSAAVLSFFTGVLLVIAMLRQELAPWRAPGRWLESVVLPVLLIIAPASILIGLLTQDLSGMVDLLLDPIIWFLALVLRVLAFVLFVLAMIILIPIVWVISKLPIADRPAADQTPLDFSQATFESASEGASGAPDLLRYVFAAVFVVAIVVLISRFRLRLGYQQDDDEAGQQTQRVEGRMIDHLRGWLSGLRGERIEENDPLAHLRGDDRWRHTVRIRERYADFLRWSAEQRNPRRVSTTPDELGGLWAVRATTSRDDAIRIMTDLYDQARYGEQPMAEEDARKVEEAWKIIASSTVT